MMEVVAEEELVMAAAAAIRGPLTPHKAVRWDLLEPPRRVAREALRWLNPDGAAVVLAAVSDNQDRRVSLANSCLASSLHQEG
jgi:hypothetical protein